MEELFMLMCQLAVLYYMALTYKHISKLKNYL